jgi:hypothetical protein
MTDREEDAVVEDLGASAVAVHTREIAHVVAVSLQPPDHRVLGVEDKILGTCGAGVEGAIVADLIGTARVGAGPSHVEAVAAIVVIGLPGRIGRLEQQVGVAVVVADDEDDMARARYPALAHEPGDVDPRRRVSWDRPRRRFAPVAAVDESSLVVGQAVWLVLRQRHRRSDRRHFASPHPAVVAQPIDVEPIGAGVGIDLEVDGLPLIDADVRGEALDARSASAADVLLAGRVPRFGVLTHDRVEDGRIAGSRQHLFP